MDVGGQQEAGGGDRPEVLVVGAGLGGVHRRPRLGEEVLHDHLLHVTVAAVALGNGA